MSRVLFAWELGRHLGHLASIQPLAMRLLAKGHRVLVAARELNNAPALLGTHGIPFVQAPFQTRQRQLLQPPCGYADILLSQGWGDADALAALLDGWRKVLDAFVPDLVVLDHSPTAYLAARIAGVPAVAVGNGFELPPLAEPLPPFPGFSWATDAAVAHSEARVIGGVNGALELFGAKGHDSLASVFDGQHRILTTVPELDHYGPRPTAHYSGPLLAMSGADQVDWPPGPGKRVFAYLRQESCDVEAVLRGLTLAGACAVCFVPDADSKRLQAFAGPLVRVTSKPVDLVGLVQTADACVSYSAVGTAFRFLFAGVPLLLMPKTAEAQMGARRIENLGAGLVVRGRLSAASIAMLLERVVAEEGCRRHARAFALRYAGLSLPQVANEVTGMLLCRLAK